MWKIYETDTVTKNLRKLPHNILLKYKAWIEIVKNGGAANLKNYSGFKDHKLQGNLKEARASRLNIQYRVIYTEDKKEKMIVVIKVTPHEYKE